MLGIAPDRRKRILALALPIIGGMVSQNVLNLVDTLMVGQLGKEALAAVGFGGFANFMATAFITGMGAGVQAMVARRKGEGRDGETAVPLNGGLVIVSCIAVPLSLVLIALTPEIFAALSSDDLVVSEGIPYLRARLVAMIAIGANFAFRGYWNGVNLSALYLRTLLVMHACNVVLNFVLIFGYLGLPALGTTGAGVGTAISTFIGTGYYFILGRRYAGESGFLAAMPRWRTLKTIMRVSVPSGVQTFLFAAGLTTLFAIIDRVGTAEAAAANVIINISLVAFLPALGLGLAAASLVGQALGKGDVDDAARWGWEVVRIGCVLLVLIGLPMAAIPELILAPFFPDEPEPLALAIAPLRLAGFTIGVEAFTMVLLNAIVGAGATTLALVIAVTMQWGVFLPLAYYVGPVRDGGLLAIWVVNVGHRALMAAVLAAVWASRRWASVKL